MDLHTPPSAIAQRSTEGLVLTVLLHGLAGVGLAGAGLWMRVHTPQRALWEWAGLWGGIAAWIGLYVPIHRAAVRRRLHFRPAKDSYAGLRCVFLPLLQLTYAPPLSANIDARGLHWLSVLGIAVWILLSGACFEMTGIPISWIAWRSLLSGTGLALGAATVRLLTWWI